MYGRVIHPDQYPELRVFYYWDRHVGEELPPSGEFTVIFSWPAESEGRFAECVQDLKGLLSADGAQREVNSFSEEFFSRSIECVDLERVSHSFYANPFSQGTCGDRYLTLGVQEDIHQNLHGLLNDRFDHREEGGSFSRLSRLGGDDWRHLYGGCGSHVRWWCCIILWPLSLEHPRCSVKQWVV